MEMNGGTELTELGEESCVSWHTNDKARGVDDGCLELFGSVQLSYSVVSNSL